MDGPRLHSHVLALQGPQVRSSQRLLKREWLSLALAGEERVALCDLLGVENHLGMADAQQYLPMQGP